MAAAAVEGRRGTHAEAHIPDTHICQLALSKTPAPPPPTPACRRVAANVQPPRRRRRDRLQQLALAQAGVAHQQHVDVAAAQDMRLMGCGSGGASEGLQLSSAIEGMHFHGSRTSCMLGGHRLRPGQQQPSPAPPAPDGHAIGAAHVLAHAAHQREQQAGLDDLVAVDGGAQRVHQLAEDVALVLLWRCGGGRRGWVVGM